jgi:uncharacterized protein YecE (DUF72 family)
MGMMKPQSQMAWFIGTIGFGYDDWRGGFFPQGVKSQNYLSHYSRIFNAVEIDTTLHAVPKTDVLQRWLHVTPDGFRFALKMPKQITHSPDINRSRLALHEFISVARTLGEKLGPILIQFPPSFQIEQIDGLEQFLSELPRDIRFAVEVRHQSWYTRQVDDIPAMAELLRGLGICWVATEFPGLPAQIWPTSDFSFIRWIGKNGSFNKHTHERIDRKDQLISWKNLIDSNSSWIEEIYGFFNNDYAGFAPGTANLFKKIIGLQVEDFQPPTQGRLF